MSDKPLNETIEKDAATIFRALDGLDQVLKPDRVPTKKPGFHEIFAYVNDPQYEISPTLGHALKNDLNVRRDIKALISKNQIVDLGFAIAASSGDILERSGEGFKITLKPVANQKDQLYLIIDTEDRDEIPRMIFIELGEVLYRLPIESFYDGQAQMIVEKESDIVKALHNPKSHVILS